MPELQWHKSSYSEASGNNCVEVASTGGGVALRESERPERVLLTGRNTLGALIRGVKAGTLELPPSR